MTGLVGFEPSKTPGPMLELIQSPDVKAETGLAHIVVSTASLEATAQHLQVCALEGWLEVSNRSDVSDNFLEPRV